MADKGAEVASGMQSLPVRQMLRDLALGVVDAQRELDEASIAALKAAKETIEVDGKQVSRIDLGLIPTFYQFREATIDLSFSLSMHIEESIAAGIQAHGEVQGGG